MCGGTETTGYQVFRRQGLSPRVRGNPAGDAKNSLFTRSIPACAGEPATPPSAMPSPTVYPRVCGGTAATMTYSGAIRGLSPRVRGNHWSVKDRLVCMGSIPACAGEPRGKSPSTSERRVYPRVCGGTGWSGKPLLASKGLSPRVRGNPPQGLAQSKSQRSIPACAGEPRCPISRSDCPASTIFAGWRQSVLPVHLLGLAPLLGSVGPVAGDVKLQDDGVVHDPVNRRGGGHGVGKDALPLREDQV